ncbi:MAG: DUF1570 domain-containing protein, partial [Planctomycetota bacterium]
QPANTAAPDASLPRGVPRKSPGLMLICDGSDSLADTCHRACSRLLTRLREIFPPRDRDHTTSLRILVFETRDRYRQWADVHAPENADVTGYFAPATGDVVATHTGTDAALIATLAHELTHAVVRDHLGTRFLPPWLDEGLASVYETAQIADDGTVTFGALHEPYARMVGARLRSGESLDLRRLATMGYGLFANRDRQKMLDNYAVAWSLLWYILNGERGLYHGTLRLYLTEIAAVPDRSTQYVAAYDTVVSPRADSLVAGWRVWASRADEGLPPANENENDHGHDDD